MARFRHAGREYDAEAGLYYNRARYYDPQLGRFISEDPIGIAGGLNLYAYAGNDPVNDQDPSGLCHKGKPHSEDPPGTVCMPPITSNPPDGSWSDPYCGNWESYSDPVCEIKRSECTGHWVMGPGVCVAPEDPWSGNEGGGFGGDGTSQDLDVGKYAQQQCSYASFAFGTTAALDGTFAYGLYKATRPALAGNGLVRLGLVRGAAGEWWTAGRNAYRNGLGTRALSDATVVATFSDEAKTSWMTLYNGAITSSLSVKDFVPILATKRAFEGMSKACLFGQ